MNRTTPTGLVATAFALLAIFVADAAAQAPILNARAVGESATIEWTPIAGAAGYTLGVGTASGATNLIVVNLPAAWGTRIVVKPPAGTYYIRVRGFLGSLAGPESNEAAVTVSPVPPSPCDPPAAPAVTATVTGLSVALSWTPIAGATGYQVQWSRFSGGTELVDNSAAASVSRYVGVPGTYFARVMAVTPCGNSISEQVSFTLTAGAGPRTPDPPPGQLLPIPSYAAAVIDDMARRHPADLARACKTQNTWLFRVLQELRKHDSRWGLNWKRGDRRQGMSSDIIAYNPSNLPDNGNGRVYIFDVIGAECEGNYPTFNNVTNVTWAAAGDPLCGTGTSCTLWTLEPYLLAGFAADQR